MNKNSSLAYSTMRLGCIILTLFMLTTTIPLATPVVADSRSSHSGSQNTVVEQFGTGFDETIIATVTNSLNKPRDLQFHPGQTDDLWVANRATDSITIIHDAGKTSQWTENRDDAYSNHFMEEVSSFAFGQYSNEHDWIFATAQETRNTYDGQQAANNFMGPALWPSDLSEFAMVAGNWAATSTCCTKALTAWVSPMIRVMHTGTLTAIMAIWSITISNPTTTLAERTTMTASSAATPKYR